MALYTKILTALFIIGAATSWDLDIILPPGTPYDALMYSPNMIEYKNRQIITGGGANEDAGESKNTGGTGVIKASPPVIPPKAPPPISFGVQSNIPVPVKDFETEVGRWINEIAFGTDPVADPLDYETRLSKRSRLEMYARVFTHMFLKHFHQNKTLDYHDTLAMTLMGAPAGSYSGNVYEVSNLLHLFSKRTLDYISPETEVPEFSGAKGAYDNMISKLVILELVSFHPFSPSPFAPGLSNFPVDDIYPYVKKLLDHPNKRVSRNALFYIGAMGNMRYLDDLFEVLKSTGDNVKKVRSLYFLTMAEYPGLEEYLIKRVEEEEDKIFRVMIIDSLGKLESRGAFPVLIGMMEQITEGDFNEAYSLTRALVRCVNFEDEESVEKLHDLYWKLYKMADDPKNFPDPVNAMKIKLQPPPPILSYVPQSRKKIIRELVEVALAVLGNKAMLSKTEDYLTSAANNIQDVILSNPPPEGGTLKKMQPASSSFIVEMAPFLNRGRSRVGKWFLEQIIQTGNVHESNVFIAIDTYAKDYPADFERLVIQMIKNNVYPTAIDRALKYMYLFGLYGDKIERVLEQIIKKYNANAIDSERHLATLATYYLGIRGKLREKDLARMVNYGLNRLSQEEGWDHEVNQTTAWGSTFKTRNYLHLVAIEMLGFLGSKKAGEILTKVAAVTDVDTRRIVAKALGNFKGGAVKKKLFDMLLDSDGWVRVNAYQSLYRITAEKHDADWYFSERSELLPHIQDYRHHVLE